MSLSEKAQQPQSRSVAPPSHKTLVPGGRAWEQAGFLHPGLTTRSSVGARLPSGTADPLDWSHLCPWVPMSLPFAHDELSPTAVDRPPSWWWWQEEGMSAKP